MTVPLSYGEVLCPSEKTFCTKSASICIPCKSLKVLRVSKPMPPLKNGRRWKYPALRWCRRVWKPIFWRGDCTRSFSIKDQPALFKKPFSSSLMNGCPIRNTPWTIASILNCWALSTKITIQILKRRCGYRSSREGVTEPEDS